MKVRNVVCQCCSIRAGHGDWRRACAASANAQTVLIDFGPNRSFRGVVRCRIPMRMATPGTALLQVHLSRPDGHQQRRDDDRSRLRHARRNRQLQRAGRCDHVPRPTPAEIAATDIDAAASAIWASKKRQSISPPGRGGPTIEVRFQIQGLDPTKTYNLTFFGSHKFSDNDTTVYSVYTDNTYTTLVASANLKSKRRARLGCTIGTRLLTFSGLSPQASNILYVQFVGASGRQAT